MVYLTRTKLMLREKFAAMVYSSSNKNLPQRFREPLLHPFERRREPWRPVEE